jgi:hypothetical protein
MKNGQLMVTGFLVHWHVACHEKANLDPFHDQTGYEVNYDS